jgi:hypothetical protein
MQPQGNQAATQAEGQGQNRQRELEPLQHANSNYQVGPNTRHRPSALGHEHVFKLGR